MFITLTLSIFIHHSSGGRPFDLHQDFGRPDPPLRPLRTGHKLPDCGQGQGGPQGGPHAPPHQGHDGRLRQGRHNHLDRGRYFQILDLRSLAIRSWILELGSWILDPHRILQLWN